jgi:hypothetical protein
MFNWCNTRSSLFSLTANLHSLKMAQYEPKHAAEITFLINNCGVLRISVGPFVYIKQRGVPPQVNVIRSLFNHPLGGAATLQLTVGFAAYSCCIQAACAASDKLSAVDTVYTKIYKLIERCEFPFRHPKIHPSIRLYVRPSEKQQCKQTGLPSPVVTKESRKRV